VRFHLLRIRGGDRASYVTGKYLSLLVTDVYQEGSKRWARDKWRALQLAVNAPEPEYLFRFPSAWRKSCLDES
jgi:hypothetical protein